MKDRYLLFVISLLFCCLLQAQEKIDSLLVVLDRTIENTAQYEQARLKRIDQIKEYFRTRKSTSPSDEYHINQQLFDEYEAYICDSARHYINRNIEIALQHNNQDWLNEAKLKKASILGKTGLYAEGVALLKSIDSKQLSRDQLIEYYITFEDIYLYHAEYAMDDEYQIEYLNNLYIYRDSVFLKGTIKANYGKGEALKADADRDGQDLAYVDQVGTFMNLGRNLETVMSPRWGETNSGLRLVKYPVYPTSAAIDFQNIDEVEFRLSEVYYMLAECEMRAGQADKAKELVNEVRKRYFSAGDWADVKDKPGRGFTAFDMDWMLSQWGVEFLNEGRRRRTDLRRFDKFTQGQWWFFGRATDNGQLYPAKRDRKYEWYPLPASALLVNQGLIQNPNYK